MKWEYKIVKVNVGITDLNKIGADGWEMVNIINLKDQEPILIFKKMIYRDD